MILDKLRTLIRRKPFEPFRILVSGGAAYEIRDPQSIALMKSRLFIAFPDSDRWTFVPFLHISSIESSGNGHGPSGARRPRPKRR